MRRTIRAKVAPQNSDLQPNPVFPVHSFLTTLLKQTVGCVFFVAVAIGAAFPVVLSAQGTAPTNPAKEYIYSGDRLVATVELPPPPPTITGVSPTAGAVGTAVTISGVSFGPTQGSSFVTFNGVSATPSSWTATSITAPVPSGATTGPIIVTVGNSQSNSVTFTVTTAPTISSLTPSVGPVGASVVIAGSNFGDNKGTSTVKFNGITAATTSWGNTSITATVPSGATTGSVVVTVGGVGSNGVTFTVATVPTITGLAPSVGPIGAAVTVTGNNFGSTQGGSTIKFNGVTATPTNWTATSITASVPSGATTGPVTVTVGVNTSNGVTFTVTSVPTITSLNPSSGPVGTTVTITGTNFGTTQGTVTFNGVNATPSSWGVTSITTTVPAGATTGSVVVTVGGTSSNGVTFTMTTAPIITSLNPAVGPVGTSVTISGSNFGTTQAMGTSTIKFNGTTATPTNWSNTIIVAPVPSGATTGPVVVTVNGTASNGFTFSVGSAPTVTLNSPANGAVYTAPGAIILSATASDPGGSITKVEFFWGSGNLIGTVTTSPYNFTWSNVAAGTYSIKAVATDNSGLTTTSNVASIVVGYAPQITLTSPGGVAFGAPANILLNAAVTDSDNAISKVDFFQGTNLIGTANSAPSNGPYSVTWQNVSVGSYSVNAKATDATGLSTVSNSISITVGIAPTVSLTSPSSGTTLVAPVGTVALAATASGPNGINRVEFWSGSALMIGWDDTAPYTYNWNTVGVGIYNLTAKAIDNLGITVSSASVFLNVTTPPGSCIGVGCGSYSGSGNPGYAEGTGIGAVWNYPQDGVIAKDPVSGQTSLFIADTQNNRIRMIYLEGATPGQSVLIAGTGTAGYFEGSGNGLNAYYNHPRGITATTDANGVVTALYVIDTDNQVIRKLLPPTSTYWRSQFYSGTAGSAGFVNGTATQSKYNYPRSAVPSGSYIYVADRSNNAVRKLDSAGASTTFFQAGNFNATGITVSQSSGKFYVTSMDNQTIWQVTTAGQGSIIAGTGPTGAFADGIGTAARFYFPYHLAWANPVEGEVLYVADEANQRIRKILISTNEVTTPAGSLAGYQDGCMPNLWFHEPESVAVGPTGELYVVDGTNQRIRLLNLRPPNAPSGLAATPVSTSQINLAWTDNTNNETGFKIERSTDGINFSLLTTLGADVTSYPDTGLTANTDYYYRVYAYNTTLGNTAYSGAVRATTLGNNPPTVNLTAPTNGALYTAPANITITATASDPGGSISKVEFFNGGTLLATDTTSPYSYSWNGVAAGNYTITAKATDNAGGTATSFVDIVVNALPTVSITSPSGGASFPAPVNLTLTANANDSDGTITKVEFFKGGSTKLGEVVSSPYSFLWSNVWGGSYSLTAKATDNRGAVTTSSAVNITVTGNSAPTVSITSPTNGANFTAPANITISATASDPGGSVSKVEFFENGVKLGEDTTSPYSFSWSGVAVGTYTLTAVATDNGGATTVSSTVTVNVQ